MGLSNLIKDPIIVKRLGRFKRHRRACWSFWTLVGLFGLSLGAELLCNDRPLALRYEGRWYFPVFKFYPDDAFTRSGKQTRPDYKALHESPVFRGQPGHFMIFPPIPYGPYEIIDAASLGSGETVTLRLVPLPRVGHVNIDAEGRVVSARACGFFFGTNDEAVAALSLPEFWDLPREFKEAVERRLLNAAAPAAECTLGRKGHPDLEATLSLSGFEPRSRRPDTVRITFRQARFADAGAVEAVFDRALNLTAERGWPSLEEATRRVLLESVRLAFDEPVQAAPLTDGREHYRVELLKNDISWPHGPVKDHWLGIDSAGRDVLARILYGFRISVSFGLLLVAASMCIGVLMGAVQGYYGGTADILLQRGTEIWSALPFLYVMILMGSVYGRSFLLLVFCYGIFNWIGISYYMRAEFLRLRKMPFVDAARCQGLPSRRIIRRHILPNALTPLIALLPFSLVGTIYALTALDYLGFGLPPPTPSWGQLLHQAQQFRWAWWLILYPSAALFAVMLLGVFIGEGVRDAFDPRPFTRME